MATCSNKFHTCRQPYTITPADEAFGFASIPLVWDKPYNATDYTVTCEVIHVSASPSIVGFIVVDLHSKTKEGVTCVILVGAGTTGEVIEVNAMALQD